MPFKSIVLKPGLDSQLTPTLNKDGWSLANLIRFPSSSSGQPELIGGWQLQNATPLTGPARGITSWSTLPGAIAANTVTPLVAIGTSSHLYVWDYTTVHDITPIGYTTLDASWFLSPFGEELMAVRRQAGTTPGSPLYSWTPTSGYVRATAVTNGPTAANGVIVSPSAQQVIVWGAPLATAPGTWTGPQQPMQVSWSDFSDPTTWFAAATNAAGSFPLTVGSQIMNITAAQGQMLVFTDATLYSMQFLGAPLIYGFQQLGANCGLIAPRAVAVLGGQAYWWSNDGTFFTYNGVVTPLTCPVRDLCLSAVSPADPLSQLVSASSNSRYNEVRWDFCPEGAPDVINYVSYNVVNGTWAFGQSASGIMVARSAMTDYVPTVGAPISADPLGNIWVQETGSSQDQTVAGGGVQPLPWFLQSGYSDIGDGEDFTFIDSVYPDALDTGTGIELTIQTQAYPRGPVTTSGPFESGATVLEIPCRSRGRQIAFLFSNKNNLNIWRLGRFRVRFAVDGRR